MDTRQKEETKKTHRERKKKKHTQNQMHEKKSSISSGHTHTKKIKKTKKNSSIISRRAHTHTKKTNHTHTWKMKSTGQLGGLEKKGKKYTHRKTHTQRDTEIKQKESSSTKKPKKGNSRSKKCRSTKNPNISYK
jgi:hypothetical protein